MAISSTSCTGGTQFEDVEIEHEHGRSPLSPELLMRFYRAMATARACDERMWILNRQGRANFIVTGRGHEAAQAGCASALRAGHDYALLYYRSMTAAIDARRHAGRSAVQLAQPRRRSVLRRPPAQQPLFLARAAHPHRLQRGCRAASPMPWAAPTRRRCAAATGLPPAFFGEGATAKGDFHESLNFAAIHRLPVVFVCENNGWAISVPSSLEVGDQKYRRARRGL